MSSLALSRLCLLPRLCQRTLHTSASLSAKDYCKIPGLPVNVDSKATKKSYYETARQYHIDANKFDLIRLPNIATMSKVACSPAIGYFNQTGVRRNALARQFVRHFHAKDSKVRYLDFRHRFKTSHLRLHLLIIRRQKMKKHKLRKFRKKYKALLAKNRLKREIAKEKMFRVELLSMIRDAENFDPKEYALRCIEEQNSKPVELTVEEKREELREKIRIHRYQVDYVKPRHRRAEY